MRAQALRGGLEGVWAGTSRPNTLHFSPELGTSLLQLGEFWYLDSA
jgi:hypothetical protein